MCETAAYINFRLYDFSISAFQYIILQHIFIVKMDPSYFSIQRLRNLFLNHLMMIEATETCSDKE
jgi:hypothetical protein